MAPLGESEPGRESEDAALLASLRAGEPQAFERLVRTYGPRMRAAALRLLRNEADADDALQDAFVSAFKALPRFEGKSLLGTWLHRIALNSALMKIRKRPQQEAEDVEVDELLPRFLPSGAFADDIAAWGGCQETALLREDRRATVRECIDRLPERHRMTIILRDIEGLDNTELAEKLGVNVNTAKIRVHRARQALRALLAPHLEAELS